MPFNSYTFILFFAGVLILHHLPFSWRVKKINLVWASYLFYAAWNPPLIVLLWVSTLVDWFAAKGMARAQSPGGRRTMLLLSLVLNLGLLSYFKYAGFLLDNFVWLASRFGVDFHPAAPDIVLPIGISFYTFQTLAYTIDVYRRKIEPWHSFTDYALFVSFFPQLVAGPIVRPMQFLPQLTEPRRATAAQMGWGLSLLTLGLFEKVVLADGLLAPVVSQVYEAQDSVGALDVWVASFAFAIQLFFDFAGYSTCAIGAAMCLGFLLPDNFRFPFASIGYAEFWRRWHISLSTWLRDYVYFSMGGSRGGTLRGWVNLAITMALVGLWHGASWKFAIWGTLFAVLIPMEQMLTAAFGHWWIWRRLWAQRALMLLTFTGGVLSTVFFRAHDLPHALSLLQQMAAFDEGSASVVLESAELAIAMLLTIATLITHWLMRDRSLWSVAQRIPWWGRSILLAAMLSAIIMMPGADLAYIYFQF